VHLFLAILLLSCSQFGSQIFMPALPEIAAHFDLESSTAQLIILVYFIGFGLSLLIYGPWSDLVGRRKIFIIGQLLYVFGTLFCLYALSEWMLALGRLVQGIGAGAPLIVSRTILSDQLTGSRRKNAMASLAIAASIISVFAPFLGGVLTSQFSWQGLFATLALHLIICGWIGYLYLPRHNQTPATRHSVLRQYMDFVSDGRFMLPALFKWLPTLLYLTSATFLPFIMQRRLELTPQEYGLAMMLPALGLIVGTGLAKLLHAHASYPAQLLIFLPLLFLAGIGFSYFPFSLANLLLSYSLFMIGAGAFYTLSLHLLIEPFEHKTGSVNALCGAIEMLLFPVLAVLVNRYWVKEMAALGQFYMVVSIFLLAAGLSIFYRARKRVQLLQETS